MRLFLLAANVLAPALAAWAWWRGQGWWALAGIFAVHMLTLWATLWPRCRWWGPQLLEMDTAEKEVWLTIDDGPDPEDTPVLLDALDAHGAKATFFLIGEKAARWPELAREIARRGHMVGNHTMTHPQYAFWRLGPRALARELDLASSTLRDILGEEPALFRAPAGMRNFFLHPLLRARGLPLIGWSARGLDGHDTDRERILRRVLRGVRPGAILLLHEGKRDAAGRPLAQDCVPRLLEELRARGYRSRALPAAFSAPHPAEAPK